MGKCMSRLRSQPEQEKWAGLRWTRFKRSTWTTGEVRKPLKVGLGDGIAAGDVEEVQEEHSYTR